MRFLGKSAWPAAVWLTAAMTLAAGFPGLRCRCPDGRQRALWFALFSGAPDCCDRPCCSPAHPAPPSEGASPDRHAAEKSCCAGHPRPHPAGAETPSSLRHPGCTRGLIPPAEYAPSPAAPDAHPDLAAVFAPADALIPALPPGADAHPAWSVHTVSPPTDLVIVLQHFLL